MEGVDVMIVVAHRNLHASFELTVHHFSAPIESALCSKVGGCIV